MGETIDECAAWLMLDDVIEGTYALTGGHWELSASQVPRLTQSFHTQLCVKFPESNVELHRVFDQAALDAGLAIAAVWHEAALYAFMVCLEPSFEKTFPERDFKSYLAETLGLTPTAW